jgi:hypothetical protein
VVTGTTWGNIDFGLGPACEYGGSNAYLMAVGADGVMAWGDCVGVGFDEAGAGLALDHGGELVWTGTMAVLAQFGQQEVYCPNHEAAVFLAHATTTGEVTSAECYDGELDQYSTNVAVDPSGNTIVTGYFMGDLSFGTGTLEACAFDAPGDHPQNGPDMFVAKLTP